MALRWVGRENSWGVQPSQPPGNSNTDTDCQNNFGNAVHRHSRWKWSMPWRHLVNRVPCNVKNSQHHDVGWCLADRQNEFCVFEIGDQRQRSVVLMRWFLAKGLVGNAFLAYFPTGNSLLKLEI